ncbi:MAG: hypothetical protein JSU63_16430 [Phycisphaerales bacterium]|nr:MAG: hypothetical protein JSU63_16430 [Phycisphaerales bacterium]
MLEAIGKYVGARVVTALICVASAGGVIWFWKHPEHLEMIWQTLKFVVAWIGFVVVLPWATFFVTPWVTSKDSNAAAATMLIGYFLADIIVAWWLMGTFQGHGALTWVVLLLGFLSAGVYNFKVCEYVADRAEEM